MTELLVIEDLEKSFTLHQLNQKEITGCRGINLILKKGQCIGITGKSGAGKSTVLKSIYRTYTPLKGKIIYHSSFFGNVDLVQATEREILMIRRKEIGYVSQFLNVMPRVTAHQIVMDELMKVGEESETAKQKAEEILAHFRLPSSLWYSYPRTFSGGEKLRLNLAQAMVKQPTLLLLDEPTASLDQTSKEAVKEMIMQLKEKGTSMIGIFHDLEFMETVVDEHYHLAGGDLRRIISTK